MLNQFTIAKENARPDEQSWLAFSQTEPAAIHYAREYLRNSRNKGDLDLQVKVVSYGKTIWTSKNDEEMQS